MNIRRGTIALGCLLSIAGAGGLEAFAKPRQQPGTESIPVGRFELLPEPGGFALHVTANGLEKRVAIPRDWLIPPEEEKGEEGRYVSSFEYDKEVSSFPIGDGQTGLHLSSYAIQEQGSAQAAAGRDVFLIFDAHSFLIFRGGIERGITKERVRGMGCFEASAERYLLADVDGDGLIDIGVVKEQLECIPMLDQKQDLDWVDGPFYKTEPVVWYVYRHNIWNCEPALTGKFPEHYQELPLIGIDKTPVDFVGSAIWETTDRTKWPRRKKARKNGAD